MRKPFTNEFLKAWATVIRNANNERLINSANLVADFWFTSWIDARKPDLSAITPGWLAHSQSKLENELQAFKNNKLLESKLLLSKKTEARESN